jgi:hypothetical protein
MNSHWSYRLRPRTVGALRLLAWVPPSLRLPIAERFLRRPEQPGPAAEHVLQYLVSSTIDRGRGADANPGAVASRPEVAPKNRVKKPVLVGQADFFYKSQYRQYATPTMGAFAMTATGVLAATSGSPTGVLFGRRRPTVAAMLSGHCDTGAAPIVVLSGEAVALAVFLPSWDSPTAAEEVARWVGGQGPLPSHYADLESGVRVAGDEGVPRTRVRHRAGSAIGMVGAALRSCHLSLLALHPHDPDAMGLHLTLFAVEALDADALEEQYSLPAEEIAAHRRAASDHHEFLVFLVGGTEEVFTQCSQNLFVKEALDSPSGDEGVVATGNAAIGAPSLEGFLSHQFEAVQITASADGVPGASPRNGQIGRACFVGHRFGRAYLLIPYHPGNAIHGHAAKLWSNPFSTVVIPDDHTEFRCVALSGASGISSHASVLRRFEHVAALAAQPVGEAEATTKEPVYWFVMRIEEILWEQERLAGNRLVAERAACTINAEGEGRHTKKPKYFATAVAAEYDMALQHQRESAGRPVDPTGVVRDAWVESLEGALALRREHLATLGPG